MKKILIVLCIIFLAPIFKVKALADNAKSAILIDSYGNVLFEKNSNEKLAPASMTKMMSMLLVLESIEKGVINWDDMVRISSNASSMGGSQILLETNEEMSVKDLFKGVAVASGNDAVVALAEAVAGSVDAFVKMMNDKAISLGLTDTYFKNPHGLNDTNHYSTAHDMALIAKELSKHPLVFEYTSIYEDYLRQGTNRKLWLVNTNKLVRFYKGVDGFKTGYTDEAGYCLTATADKGFRVIAVVMGEATSELRNKEVSEMLDYAYATYRLDTILTKEKVLANLKVDRSLKKADIVVKEDVAILNKKQDGNKEYTYNVRINNLSAPISILDKVGEVDIYEGGNLINTVDLTVKEDIKKDNIIKLYFRYLKEIVTI